MIEFEILKKSRISDARLGILKTQHGEVETPAFVPVASQASVKTLTSREAEDAGCRILIANTFLLHDRPGEGIVKRAGGLHNFMQWPRPLMTDSGGFQVFSLGFGKDLGIGKIAARNTSPHIKKGVNPAAVKIADDGAYFKSPFDGKTIFLGPQESMKIQGDLGADIIFAFDECTPPGVDRAYMERSLKRTHAWAKICLEEKKENQAIFGITQGSKFRDLREKSAKFISSLPFDGFGIGGDLGENKHMTEKILFWTMRHLNPRKPRHLLGIGHLDDIARIIRRGIDLFDCTAPTHYARNGVAFTSAGKMDMRKSAFLKDKKPLDLKCKCEVCGTYSRSYLSHLVRSGEITGLRHLTFHNLFYFNAFVTGIRKKIKNGTF
ncbi:MAG: tRNA guanosine(34) transglycosylase Tgt [Candidatus Sungbacteria bacterium]|nr:tRNA guanosine(34) transglycosylase Tgt [Candidatus Sungbacteria bacterium]